MGRHDDEHLRKFLAARGAGDADGMRHWWEELVIDLHDRIDGMVWKEHGTQLDHHEHDDAVQEVLIRFTTKLVQSFKGTSMGELVNALKTLIHFTCIDLQRAAERHSKRRAALDAGWTGADEDQASPKWEAEAASDAFDAERHQADMDAFVAWALPQLVQSRRAVWELTFAGVPIPEIMERLDLSRDNAYQLRSRGLKDLAKLYQQYDA